MSKNQFLSAVSAPRFNRYLNACDNNKRKALKLYNLNILLAKNLYAVISVFEVALRNSINRHMSALHGSEWLAEAVQHGGYLDVGAGCEDSYHAVQEAIQMLGNRYSHDRLIAKLTLGFWRYHFAPKEFAASGSTLLAIFCNRPHGTKQKDILKSLIKINEIRNRIAHHEPICFEGNNISVHRAKRRYDTIIELMSWMGFDPAGLMRDIDVVGATVDKFSKF